MIEMGRKLLAKRDNIHRTGKSKRATMGATAAATMMSDSSDIASRVREPELKGDRDFLADQRGGGVTTSVALTGRRQTAGRDEMSAGLVMPGDGIPCGQRRGDPS